MKKIQVFSSHTAAFFYHFIVLYDIFIVVMKNLVRLKIETIQLSDETRTSIIWQLLPVKVLFIKPTLIFKFILKTKND